MPLDDYSAKAFNYLVRYYRVLDAFIAVRASYRLKARVARERARFLYYLDATEYDPNSRVSNVRLRKDANKVKRSPLAVAAFREEEATKSRYTATKANTIAARSASALEPTVATAPNDSNDNKDGKDSNSSDSSASNIDEYY
ncbi:hypothetical protein D6D21_10746 [Aureobasidium pullulans]|uniref:Uncharacterized protein n=1 Tax=Aureobasidium pullulans TaxID=5580 RepID=A0AB74IHA2_AURPU|nr:hypothetical protein D6D21_10746 [Aureobasidium pullulans]